MQKFAFFGTACLAVALAAGDALAGGNCGGPNDAVASPYSLYFPQSFAPPSWTQDRAAYVAIVAQPPCQNGGPCSRAHRASFASSPSQ